MILITPRGVTRAVPNVNGTTGPLAPLLLEYKDYSAITVVRIPRNVKPFLSSYIREITASQYEHDVLMRLADDESDFDSLADNPGSAAFGLFQYMPDTWAGQCSGAMDDWMAQTRCALQDIRAGRLSQWEVVKNW